VRESLGPRDITKIARVVIVERSNPALKAVSAAGGVEHSLLELEGSNFFGLTIKHDLAVTAV